MSNGTNVWQTVIDAATPQTVTVNLPNLGTDRGISKIELALSDVTQIPGWCADGFFPSGPQTGDDFSFSPDGDLRNITVLPETQSDHGNLRRILASSAHLRLFCKDTGGKCALTVTPYGRDGMSLGSLTVTVPVDENGDGIADVWEKDKIIEHNALHPGSPLVWSPSFNGFTANGGDNEPAALGNRRTDGSYSHAAAGDGLTVQQEYRGRVVDGGAGFTGSRHVRFSPARKELFVQVSVPELASLLAETGTGPAANTGALSAFDVDEIMQSVAQLYAHSTKGAGIDLYWVKRPFVPLQGPAVMNRPNAYRYTGDMEYRPEQQPSVFPTSLNGSAWISADWEYRKLVGRTAHNVVFPTHNGMFELMMEENRDMVLSRFVMLLMPSRHAHVMGTGIPVPDNPPYTTIPQLANAFCITDIHTPNFPLRWGAVVNLVGLAEEAPFAYSEPHYNDNNFKQILAWAIAHEIAHLLGCSDNPVGSGILMGPRCFISACTVSSFEISQINLKNKKGATP